VHTVQNYVGTLKEAARTYGIHLSKRMQEYEKVMMDMRWRLRLLRNGDAEDRNYHRLTPQSILEHLEKELERLEEVDKTYAKEKHKVFLGRIG
jgi:ethanolamine utilization cobalamin adenosyltransferase